MDTLRPPLLSGEVATLCWDERDDSWTMPHMFGEQFDWQNLQSGKI